MNGKNARRGQMIITRLEELHRFVLQKHWTDFLPPSTNSSTHWAFVGGLPAVQLRWTTTAEINRFGSSLNFVMFLIFIAHLPHFPVWSWCTTDQCHTSPLHHHYTYLWSICNIVDFPGLQQLFQWLTPPTTRIAPATAWPRVELFFFSLSPFPADGWNSII